MLYTAEESLFWYWIRERHNIFLLRQQGLPKPWTTDPILQQYKFTNPFRENDRGTVWLRENFLEPYKDANPTLIAFNICWYRMFNWWGTGEALGWRIMWDPKWVKEQLDARAARGEQIFTGAHIVYSRPGLSKIDAIIKVCWDLYCIRQDIVWIANNIQTLEHVFERLRTIDCVGGFMAYEMVTDMRHTTILCGAKDIMTWANIGPGAKRGLQRLGMPVSLDSMRKLLGRSADQLPSDFPLLEMRDIEHSLCEFDKYCRVKFGEGYPRGKFDGV